MIAERAAASIRAESVCKSYVRNGVLAAAVDALSLDVGPGEFLGIVGPSGCGKSTLLMMLAGLYPPSSGKIAVDGRAVDGPCPGVGMVFQRDVLFEWRTVLANVLLPVEVKRLPRNGYRTKALELLELVNLRDYADAYPQQLSGGMRQRVACRALIHEPRLLLMDEPFGALDALTREKLDLDLLQLTAQSRQTVVFVTHSIEEAVLISDRVLVMTASPGRIFREVRVAFDGPRTIETRSRPEYLHYVSEIRDAFHSLGVI